MPQTSSSALPRGRGGAREHFLHVPARRLWSTGTRSRTRSQHGAAGPCPRGPPPGRTQGKRQDFGAVDAHFGAHSHDAIALPPPGAGVGVCAVILHGARRQAAGLGALPGAGEARGSLLRRQGGVRAGGDPGGVGVWGPVGVRHQQGGRVAAQGPGWEWQGERAVEKGEGDGVCRVSTAESLAWVVVRRHSQCIAYSAASHVTACNQLTRSCPSPSSTGGGGCRCRATRRRRHRQRPGGESCLTAQPRRPAALSWRARQQLQPGLAGTRTAPCESRNSACSRQQASRRSYATYVRPKRRWTRCLLRSRRETIHVESMGFQTP